MAIQSERAQIDGSINIDGSIFQYQVEFTGGGGGGTGDVAWASGDVGANNEILTAAGDGSIVAESGITWDGTDLSINGMIKAVTSSTDFAASFDQNHGSGDGVYIELSADSNNQSALEITGGGGADALLKLTDQGDLFLGLLDSVSPIANVLYYNTTTKEVNYGTAPSSGGDVYWASGNDGSGYELATAVGDGSIAIQTGLQYVHGDSELFVNDSITTDIADAGGALSIYGGRHGSGGTGGKLTLEGGRGTGTTGGAIELFGGDGATVGGNAYVAGGIAINDGQGGHVYIRGGSGEADTDGNIYIGVTDTQYVILSTSSISAAVPAVNELLFMDTGSSNVTRRVSGALPVAVGGTGLTTVATDYLLTGNGTGALTAESTLRYNGSQLRVYTGAAMATELNEQDFVYSGSTVQTLSHGIVMRNLSHQTIDYHGLYYNGTTGTTYGGMFHRQGSSYSDLRQDFDYLKWYTGTTSGTSTERFDFNTTSFTFNESGADMDFRIESDANPYMFFIDGGNNYIGINEITPNCQLDVSGMIRTTGSGSPGAGTGLELFYIGNPVGDGTSYVSSYRRTATARYEPLVLRGTNVDIYAASGTTARENLSVNYSEVVVNDPGADVDLRKESTSGVDYAFFVRGVSPPKIGMGECISETEATYKMLNLRFSEANSSAKLTSVGMQASNDSMFIYNDYGSVGHASIDFKCDTDYIDGYNSSRFGFYGYGNSTSESYNYFFWTGGVSTTAQQETMRLTRLGNLHTRANMIAYSTTITSDERLKENVEVIEDNALDKVMKLRPVTFNWIDKTKKGDDKVAGLIAQELEEIFPELIFECTNLDDENGPDETVYKHINYNELLPYLIKTVQIQQEKADDQQKEIDDLKQKVELLLEKL